jgi:galactokinase
VAAEQAPAEQAPDEQAPDEQAPAREIVAFAPGRVNLIGEHTDYNQGLALPFAIAEGVTVRARVTGGERVRARALDLQEEDDFDLSDPPAATGWRAFVRGAVAELARAGFTLRAAELEISGDLDRGSGLSSSAALEVALCLALLGSNPAVGRRVDALDRRQLARVCSTVENDWVGAHTGLLDQLASLFGRAGAALRIDFADLSIQPVPLTLESGWRLVSVDSGERHSLAASGYNERRRECTEASRILGIESLREAEGADLSSLPAKLARRVRHVLGENARVEEAVSALEANDLKRVGALLDASHASLRDQYECSTPAVEATVERLRRAGAVGARMVGGGFGGHVLALLAPDTPTPEPAQEVFPGVGAHLLGA